MRQVPLLDPARIDAWQVEGDAAASVRREAAPGGVLRLTTLKRPANVWDAQLSATPNAGVKKGDVLLATFRVRAIKGQAETGEARTSLVVERGEIPWAKSIEQEIPVSREWRTWNVPFTAAEDLPAGKLRVHFRLGYDPQVFELADVALTDYGAAKLLKDLPRTSLGYVGREPDAPWRREALARIEKIRKSEMKIQVVDSRGKPVPGAKVRVRQTRHGFAFGSAVAADFLLASGADADRYRQIVAENFTRVTLENHLKWGPWEVKGSAEWGPAVALRALAWLAEHRIEVRGHNLIWPSWRNSPDDLKSLAGDPKALARRVDAHISEEAGAVRGKVVDWDVVNETFDNHDVTDILGHDALIHWFRLARRADPKPRLFLNDYPALDGAAKTDPHLNHFAREIEFLKAGGAPLGGIGFQCHFGGNVIPPARILSGLDRFARYGLPIAITELDVNTTDERLQADYLRDFHIAAFSHPAVDSIVQWGFWAGRHWLPDAALWAQNWTLRPVGAAWRELVHETWKTDAALVTGKDGAASVRGFLGDYEVTVNGKTVAARLESKGATVRLVV